MTKSDLLALRDLSKTKELVSLEKIPPSFKDDFDKFFFGKTLLKKEGQLYAYPNDIKSWVSVVFDSYIN